MDCLREGASGPDVVALQNRLKDKGFSPGLVDGSFGPGTEAAVMAFQKSQGLVADGVVGPATATGLGFAAADVPAPPSMPSVTLGIASKMFPFTPLDNINRNLPHVLSALQKAGLSDLPIVLAALATIRAETEGFMPIAEGISRFNTSPGGHPFDLYDRRADLGNQGPPDGASFKGRGYVQLTGRVNYAHFGPLVGAPDLVTTPDQACDPDIAAAILAAFITSRRVQIKQALLAGDLAGARRQVNGGSNGLDRFSEAYKIGERLLSA